MSFNQRVVRIQLPSKPLLGDLTIKAKNLYNSATYYLRQIYFNTGRKLGYYALWKALNQHKDYLALKVLAGGQTPQQLLRQVEGNWKAFSNASADWQKQPKKYFGKPKIPGYLPKNGKFNVLWSNQQVRVQKGWVLAPKKVLHKGFPRIPTSNIPVNEQNIRSLRLVPFYDRYMLEIIYLKKIEQEKTCSLSVLGIDLGINNLVATSDGLLIKGKIVKSFNQYFNKKQRKWQAALAKQTSTKRLRLLQRKRYNKIMDYFHKASNKIIQHCVEKNIGLIVIGKNKYWKQKTHLGKVTNQKFSHIPFRKLIFMLYYKAKEFGITLKVISEEYTSQCCSNCGYTAKKNRKFRGLFVCQKCQFVCNADINGARNIARKVCSESNRIGTSGSVVLPAKGSLQTFVYK